MCKVINLFNYVKDNQNTNPASTSKEESLGKYNFEEVMKKNAEREKKKKEERTKETQKKTDRLARRRT